MDQTAELSGNPTPGASGTELAARRHRWGKLARGLKLPLATVGLYLLLSFQLVCVWRRCGVSVGAHHLEAYERWLGSSGRARRGAR